MQQTDVKQISPEILSDIFNFKIKIFLSIYISHTIYTSLLYLCVVFKVKLRRMILPFYQNNVYHEIVYCSSLFFFKKNYIFQIQTYEVSIKTMTIFFIYIFNQFFHTTVIHALIQKPKSLTLDVHKAIDLPLFRWLR